MASSKPVLYIDSGIGGIPYCVDFHGKNPNEEVCYLADTQNFPYGPRGKDELTSILIKLTKKLLIAADPKIIVLACNTATISALASLRQRFGQIPFVGTVPALKPAAKVSSKRKVGVLGTERTIADIRALNLVDESCEIIGIAAPELVKFVEHHFDKASKEEKAKIARKYIDLFRAEGVDSLVLGCTHFLYLLDEFRREAASPVCSNLVCSNPICSNPDFAPDIEVFDSLDGIRKRIEFLLDENDGALRAEKNFKPSHKFILTSKDAQYDLWQSRAQTFGFELKLLNDI